MNPFSREPLKEFIEKYKQQEEMQETEMLKDEDEKTHVKVEHLAFSIILSVFIVGFLVFSSSPQQQITGMVIYDEATEVVNISRVFATSDTITIVLKGNITSLSITGEFIGNGTGRIWLGDRVIVDKTLLEPRKGGNLITGLAIEEITDAITAENSTEAAIIETNETLITEIILNETGLNDTILIEEQNEILSNLSESNVTIDEQVEPNISIDIEVNETPILNLSENISINETQILDENISAILENVTEPIVINETVSENVTIDIPIIEENITLEENITQPVEILIEEQRLVFENYCLETCNLAGQQQEITLRIELNDLQLNLSSITYRYLVPEEEAELIEINLANLTELQRFNFSIKQEGLKILNYNEELKEYNVGIDENEYVKLVNINLTQVNISFRQTNDTRLSSKIFIAEGNIENSELKLFAPDTDVILKCLQFENETCKKWQKTDIPFAFKDSSIVFKLPSEGIYSGSRILKQKKEFIATNSVYYNSDCEYCEDRAKCQAEKLCLIQNKYPHNANFIAQLDFNIYDLDSSLTRVELCGYQYYNTKEMTLNYLTYSPESHCSDIRNGNMTSSLLSYKLIQPEKGWTCIDATEIVRESQNRQESNVFINWLGQDVNQENHPFTCYYGIASLDNCGGYNPSGAADCRPYLKVTY